MPRQWRRTNRAAPSRKKMEPAAGAAADRHSFVYDASSSERLDKALAALMPQLSRSWVKSNIGRGAVHVNGKVATKAGQKVKRGDTVTVDKAVDDNPGEAIRNQKTFELRGNPEVVLDVLYEDADLVVINKPKGVVMHPSKESGRNFDDSLCAGLIARYGLDGLSPSEDGLRPGIVHRLDVETSGAVVVARTQAALEGLQQQFATQKKDMERSYLALVVGGFGRTEERQGRIEAAIGRHPKHGTKRCVREESAARHVKSAATNWAIEELLADGAVALVRCRLETGRTHQIRVHMKHVRHPLLCDPLYGPGNMPSVAALQPPLLKLLERHQVQGQFLHAHTLGFRHPRTDEVMSFEAPLPPYWTEALEFLRAYKAP